VPDAIYALLDEYVKAADPLSADADTNSWTTDGAAMIRARAKQALKLNYQNDDTAMQMVGAYGSGRQGFSSRRLRRWRMCR